jgi:polyhydroxyalkanoate synthesis repressor PhaR
MPVIKKYENRRLYDTSASRYVNLEEIAGMVERGEEVTVTDVKSGRDLTREILLQIVLEDTAALPLPLLRRIIRTRGDEPLRVAAREQLALGLDLLEAQLSQAEAFLQGLYHVEAPAPQVVAERTPPPWGVAPPVPPIGMPPGLLSFFTGNTGSVDPRPSSTIPSPIGAPDPAWQVDPAGSEELEALRQELSRLEDRLKRA